MLDYNFGYNSEHTLINTIHTFTQKEIIFAEHNFKHKHNQLNIFTFEICNILIDNILRCGN